MSGITKKHMIDAAETLRIVRNRVPERVHGLLVEVFSDFFRGHNGRFDRERFYDACGAGERGDGAGKPQEYEAADLDTWIESLQRDRVELDQRLDATYTGEKG